MVARMLQPFSSDIAGRIKDAQDTCRRWNNDLAIDSDLSEWPNLEDEGMRAFGYLPEAAATMPLEEASAGMLKLMRNPGDGLTLLQAQCGLGKTTTFRQVAIENAKKEGRLGVKSALSVPTNKVAIEQFDYIKSVGEKVQRRFGPLSVLRDDGTPECRYHAQGKALAAGGISVAVALCRGCAHRKECKAVDGFVGDEDARIALGPHELVSDLVAFAGQTGLVAIDEPPDLLDEFRFSSVDIGRAFDELGRGWFSNSYAPMMRPILNGVMAWMSRVDGPKTKGKAHDGDDHGRLGPITRGLTTIDPSLENAAFEYAAARGMELVTPVEWATHAVPADYVGNGPPIHEGARNMLRVDLRSATAAGEAGRISWLIRRAVLDEEGVSAVVERNEDTGVAELVLVPTNERMHDALRRAGPTVLMAADANVVRPLVERVLGCTSPLLAFRAPEPMVERTLWRMRGATRKGWLKPQLNIAGIADAIDRVVTWYLEAPTDKPLAIVSYMPIEAALAGRSTADIELVDRLQPIIARLPRPPVLGHYHGLRGLDEWKALDALATVGDPYQNVGTLRRQMEWARSGNLSVTTPDFWDRMHAAAELEQAHGRLRTIHRTTRARQLHVGNVEPAGWSKWKPRDGPPKRTLSPDEKETLESLVRLNGGVRAAARYLRVTYRTLKRWIASESAPEDKVHMLRQGAKIDRPS